MELYDYQRPAADALVEVLMAQRLAILNGDMGVGKTIIALDVIRRLGLPAVGVIAPKITLSAWERAAADMGVKLAFCSNPEMLRTGRKTDIVSKAKDKVFMFKLPPDSLIVFDELHRFGAPDSLVAYLLMGAKVSGCRVLGATGTLGETPLKFRAILSLANLVQWNEYWKWVSRHGCYRDHNITGSPWRFTRDKQKATEYMGEIHSMLFPKFGVRLRIKDIPEFPVCDTQVNLYDLPESLTAQVNEIYSRMRKEVRNPEAAKTMLTQLLRYRQQVQLVKVPLFIELAKELLLEGKSVVAFFDFREPQAAFVEGMRETLNETCPMVHGDQTKAARDAEIARFQENKCRVIACITQAGGIGVSIGDEDGLHPRVAIHNMPLDGISASQACGRIHRATNKSKALNVFALLAGSPVEERVYRMLRSKMRQMASVQGDDIMETVLQ